MRISIKTGHLTLTNKKVVKQMIENNITEGGYRGVDYYLSNNDGLFTLKNVCLEWDCEFSRNKRIKRTYKSTFTVK